MLYKNVKWMPQLLVFFGFLCTIHSGYCFEYHGINDTQREFVNEFVSKRYSKENDNPEYFINTSQCHIPYVDPLSPEVLKFYRPEYTTGCRKEQSLIKILYNNQANRYVLNINMEGARQYSPSKDFSIQKNAVECCYEEIVRDGTGAEADNKFILIPCKYFPQNYIVPLTVQSLLVTCKIKLIEKTIEQKSAFFLVQVKKRLKLNKRLNTGAKIKPPLYLWIIDSLSRINFRRTMPETFNYLKTKKWFELRGYNKVGLATLVNIMPLLTGHNESTAELICKPKQVGGYDQCNFIWKKFHKQHYKTAYAEDNVFLSTFNYASPGFEKQPTDYYFRPMALAIEKTLNQTLRHGLTYCVGNRQYAEYVYDSGLRFAKRFKYQAHFGIFWTNSFSHNHYSLPATMDSTTLKYLRDMERVGYLDNAIVFFLSDHGKLFHPLDKLPEAFLEDRLPTFFISIPKWFHYTYPELIKNLERNCERLTSPYDIYMTMQHLLKINEPKFGIQAATGCTRCQSLFEEIPENRTCVEAGIPASWCSCVPLKNN